MRRTDLLRAAGALALASAATPAGACTIAATGVAFGSYDPRSPLADVSSGTITLSCHPSVSAPIVALGTGGSGSFLTRRMTSGANTLDYNLFTTSSNLIVWGNGLAGTATVTLTGGTTSGGVRTFSRSVFGRIPAGQNVRAGTYGDTIIVTVTF